MKIKVCGIKRIEDVNFLNELLPDYAGFVFAKSKREVTVEQAKMLRRELCKDIKTVGVFVDCDLKKITNLAEEKVIDVIQLHGEQSEDDIINLKKLLPDNLIIKAISVKTKEDILQWENSCADILLLDNGKGGTGEKFDWNILKQINIKKEYFIAGGLTPDNVYDALKFNPFGVDVSGGVETDSLKDREKIKKFIENVRNYYA